MWTFKCFLSGSGRDVIKQALDKQDKAVRARFDNLRAYLEAQPPDKWDRPEVGQLSGECKGLIELRFKANKVQHRPIGFYGPGEMEFTFLSWAVEKGSKFYPSNTCDIAQKRKKVVENDKGRACECDF